MVGIAEISAGFSSLKAAKSIVQGLNAASTQAAINEVKLDLQSLMLEAQESLFAAQESHSTLSHRVSELEQEIVRLKDWSTERENYELKQIDAGSFAFMEKEAVNSGKPPHWLCAQCFDSGHKSILQLGGIQGAATGGANNVYKCNRCNSSVAVSNRRRPDRPYASGAS